MSRRQHLNSGDNANITCGPVHSTADYPFDFAGWRFVGTGTISVVFTATADTTIIPLDEHVGEWDGQQ